MISFHSNKAEIYHHL